MFTLVSIHTFGVPCSASICNLDKVASLCECNEKKATVLQSKNTLDIKCARYVRFRRISLFYLNSIILKQTELYSTLFHRQASPELAETISQMLTNHGPLVKVRPSAAVVGIPYKRQGSLDGAQLPSSLSGQVGETELM